MQPGESSSARLRLSRTDLLINLVCRARNRGCTCLELSISPPREGAGQHGPLYRPTDENAAAQSGSKGAPEFDCCPWLPSSRGSVMRTVSRGGFRQGCFATSPTRKVPGQLHQLRRECGSRSSELIRIARTPHVRIDARVPCRRCLPVACDTCGHAERATTDSGLDRNRTFKSESFEGYGGTGHNRSVELAVLSSSHSNDRRACWRRDDVG